MAKKAAVSLDEIADRSLSEISAADFLEVLEREGSPTPEPARELGQVRVKDVLAGLSVAGRVFPEKKKAEREQFPKRREWGGYLPPITEKKKVELEKHLFEIPQDPFPIEVAGIAERLTAIEQRLEKLGK